MKTSVSVAWGRSRRKWSYLFIGIGCILLVTAFIIGISDNFPGIVSMFAGLFAIVLGIVWRFAKPGKRKPAQQWLYWAPRVLCIVMAMFISLFALDVFGSGQGFWWTTLAL